MRETDEELEAAFLGYGRIVGAQVKPVRSSRFELAEGRVVPAPLPEAVETTILPAFAEYRETWLRIRGTAQYDRHDRVQRLTELEDIAVVDDTQSEDFDRILRRLDNLKQLQDGWHDGDGKGLTERDLGWVRAVLLLALGETDLPRPGVYPTPDGNVQVEWAAGDTDITALFNLDEETVQISVCDLAEDTEELATLAPQHADQLVERLRYV